MMESSLERKLRPLVAAMIRFSEEFESRLLIPYCRAGGTTLQTRIFLLIPAA